MRSNKLYEKVLKKFITFLNNGEEREEFTSEELLAITPTDLARYFNMLAFGTENPNADDRPTKCRANTLAYVKKCLSSFMPRRTQWDPVENKGNPTKSDEVNRIIKLVKKFEVRHQGVKSSACRAIEWSELLSLLEILREDEIKGPMVCCVIALQWHLIARIDDMMKFAFSNLTANIQHSFTMLAKLRWSKNIGEERDAPEQIMMGSMCSLICPILNLGIYLESNTPHTNGGNTAHHCAILL
jgi:hypothetical protein